MGIPERARKALQAMKNFGFAPKVTTPVLKKLLEVYENNYEHIEENSYQVLIDAILEEQELQAAGKTVVEDDTEPSRKRLRKLSERRSSSSMPDGPSELFLKKPKVDAGASPDAHHTEADKDTLSEPVSSLPSIGGNSTCNTSPQPSPVKKTSGTATDATIHREKTTDVVSPQTSPSSSNPEHGTIERRERRASARKTSAAQENPDSSSLPTYSRPKPPTDQRSKDTICFKEPKIEPGTEIPPLTICPRMPTAKESNDGIPDSPTFEVPLAMVGPSDNPNLTGNIGASESLAVKNADKGKGKGSTSDAALNNGKTSDIVTSQETSSSNVDIVSSNTGEVKLKFCFNSDRPHLRMPSLDAIFKLVEERCLKSYKILQPDFSLMEVMKEMCECALELSTETSDDQQDHIVKTTPLSDELKSSEVLSVAESISDGLPGSSSGPVNGHSASKDDNNGHKENDKPEKGKVSRVPGDANPDSLAVISQPQIALGDLRPLHDPNDITKGEERVRISLVNEISNEKYPSSFHYIARNVIYQDAYVNFSLARIGDEDCCPDCFGDCVAAAVPCACAQVTSGDFAYTSDGLVKEAFLDECISMNRDPQNHLHNYCKVCPIERSKKEIMPDPCKGHLARRFIKECWSKCGCNMQCGNRVVQRGITYNLQVFYTPEGKGWGVRTLDELPKGAFVCEYVGEILTNMELYNRTTQSTANAKRAYPVLLDADWGSESILKDEEALCLDATFYGNVARFVNHRCYDANLVEIPVAVETPDHHYYHVAFFASRKIQAYEELTWDYGIDFADHGPVKAFRCRCNSKFCRDMRRSKSRSKALILT